MSNSFHNQKNMQLDPKAASQMLSNIFDACDFEQNSVPLEVLTSYSNYRKERYLAQKFILVTVMILFFLLPILFAAPNFSLTQKEGEIPGSPYVELVTTHLIPTDKIEASMGGTKMPVYETANGTYQVIPTKNGQLDVTLTLINKQYLTNSIQVSNVDTESPILISDEIENGQLVIYFEENSGLLDYENIHAQTADKTVIKPIAYNESNLSVTFEYPTKPLNIFVSDMSNNTLQIAVSLK